MAKKKVSPFVKGRAPIGSSGGGGKFLSLKDGDSMVVAPLVGLDEMVSANMHEYWDYNPAFFHPCIGRDCPGCLVANEPRFKGFLPVLEKDSGETMVYPFTVSVYKQLVELEDELDDTSLKGYVLKIKRNGSGLKTRYTIIGMGKRIDTSTVDEPDFIDQLGPSTLEDITTLLQNHGLLIDEEDEERAFASTASVPVIPVSDDGSDWGDL